MPTSYLEDHWRLLGAIEAVNGLIRRLRPGPGAASLEPKLRILWSTSRPAIKNRINLLSEDRL
jgi:hypothetical protein